MKSIKSISILLLLLFSLRTSAQTNLPFEGKWNYNDEYCSLTLFLKQTPTKVTGSHLYFFNQGGRLDGDDELISISTNIKSDDKAAGTIKSLFTRHITGKLQLTLITNDSLRFETNSDHPEFMLPQEIILKRVHY